MTTAGDDGVHPRQTSTVPDHLTPRPAAEPVSPSSEPPSVPLEPVQRWRLVFWRAPGHASGLDQGDQKASWESRLVASGLPLAGLDVPGGRPRFAIAAPLAAGIAGEAELLDLWLTRRLPRWRVREALEQVLPADHGVVDLHDVWLRAPSLAGQVVASVYRVAAPSAADRERLATAVRSMLAAPSLPRERTKGDRAVRYDLRPFLEAVVFEPAGDVALLRMTLRHDPERGVGRPEEVLAELSERAGGPPLEAMVAGLVRERLVLGTDHAGDPAPVRTPPVGPRRRGPGGPRT